MLEHCEKISRRTKWTLIGEETYLELNCAVGFEWCLFSGYSTGKTDISGTQISICLHDTWIYSMLSVITSKGKLSSERLKTVINNQYAVGKIQNFIVLYEKN